MPFLFSTRPDLPGFVVGGRVRDDLDHALRSSVLAAGVRDGSAVGKEVVVELQLEPSLCSWARPEATTNWCLAKGRIARAEAPALGAPFVVLEDVSVTTDTVPHELEASHRALLEERENGSWVLIRLTPTR